jgi:hypothetical protein
LLRFLAKDNFDSAIGLRGLGGSGGCDVAEEVAKKAILALRAKGPGLKPFDSMSLIQGAEAPCSLRKTKTGVFPQPVKPPAPSGRKKREFIRSL